MRGNSMESPSRLWRDLAIVAVAAAIAPLASSMAASQATLPNPCTLLGKVHPEKALAPGKAVVVTQGKLAKSGAGSHASSTCPEMVGTLPVYLTVSQSFGGFGGIQVTSMTRPG